MDHPDASPLTREDVMALRTLKTETIEPDRTVKLPSGVVMSGAEASLLLQFYEPLEEEEALPIGRLGAVIDLLMGAAERGVPLDAMTTIRHVHDDDGSCAWMFHFTP